MLRRIAGLCLVALGVVAGQSTAKPPDLPDDPPIIVKPECAPGEGVWTVPGQPWPTPAVKATLFYAAHPFVAFLPPQPAVTCPGCPADRHAVAVSDHVALRSVMENLQALEQAADEFAQAKKYAATGHLTAALQCLHKVQALVPGSTYDARVQDLCKFLARQSEEAAQINNHWAQSCNQFGQCWVSQVRDLCVRLTEQPISCAKACDEYVVECKTQVCSPSSCCPAKGSCPAATACTAASCCSATCCAAPAKGSKPVTLSCQNQPLGSVFETIRKETGITVVGHGDICLKQPISLHVEQMPAREVIAVLARTMNLEPTYMGDVVCLKYPPQTCIGVKVQCEQVGDCPKCAVMHAKVVQKCNAGCAEQVTGLMKACYLAAHEQRFEKAADLARQAHALDAARVEGDPIVYKFHLLGEKGKCCTEKCCPEQCCPAKKCQPATCPKAVPGVPVSVNSDAGVEGTVVINERNFDLCSLMNHECCGVKLADVGQFVKAMYGTPAVPEGEGGTFSLGLSSSGAVNTFLRAPVEGVVYNVMYKDGVFLVWMTPKAK